MRLPLRLARQSTHATIALNDPGYLLLAGWAGCRLELGTEVFELLHANRIQRTVVQKGLGQPNGLVSKQDRLRDQLLALIDLRQAVVPVEVFRLG